MNMTKKSLIVLGLALVLAITVTPLTAQQENPPRTPETEPQRDGQSPTDNPSPNVANPPQASPSPSQSPSYNSQSPNDRASTANDYDVTRADTGTSWGIPILTLLAGLIIGYFIGHSRPSATVTDMRRDSDRAA